MLYLYLYKNYVIGIRKLNKFMVDVWRNIYRLIKDFLIMVEILKV